jgi:hypothetical protein
MHEYVHGRHSFKFYVKTVPGVSVDAEFGFNIGDVHINITGGPFPKAKARPGRDADHSPPSSAEVENE